jgi:hypothetical protein
MKKKEILNGIELTAKLDGGYADSLRGPRTRGSTTTEGLTSLPEDYEAQRAVDQRLAGPGTVIFQGPNGLGGRQRAVTLSAALAAGEQVCVRKGFHGPELYVDRSIGEGQVAEHLTFIVAGESNPDGLGLGALVTWYPGEPTAPIDPECGVKLHHGL